MRILIVEDHQMMNDLLRKVCTEEFGHEVVGAVATGKAAIHEAIQKEPDLVILDLMLPDMDGFAVAGKIRGHSGATKILAISARCDAHTVFLAEEARLDGFIDKRTSMLDEFRLAIASMAARRQHFCATFLQLRSKRRRSPQGFDKLLTKRQQCILSLIGDMLSDQDIAERLKLSISTAEKHRYRIMGKLGIKTRGDLVKYARLNGFRALSDTDPAEGSAKPGG
jgi:DNA-binding NarL/FixJ family response regulator